MCLFCYVKLKKKKSGVHWGEAESHLVIKLGITGASALPYTEAEALL